MNDWGAVKERGILSQKDEGGWIRHEKDCMSDEQGKKGRKEEKTVKYVQVLLSRLLYTEHSPV